MLHTIHEILDRAARKHRTVAVAAAEDREVLTAVLAAKSRGVADSILTGGAEKIASLITELGGDPSDFEIIQADGDADCAYKAVALVRGGRADCLMKGLLPTADMMRAVIDRETGIRTEKLLSHAMLYEIPGYPKLLLNTDGGINTAPNAEQKAQILENAAMLLRKLGYEKISASCIGGAEKVSHTIPATVDAYALAEMRDRWEPYNMTVIGPVGLDLAISREACAHKSYEAEGAGEADIILVPTYEVGNGIGKALTYFANAKSAGVVVGARVPIVLVSRADDAETKLASIALGCICG